MARARWTSRVIKSRKDIIFCTNCLEFRITYEDLCRRMGIAEGVGGKMLCPICYTVIRALPPKRGGDEIAIVKIRIDEGQRFFKFGRRIT